MTSRDAFAVLGSASKVSAGELAVALTTSCKNMAGKLKGAECDRAALLQSVDMHRSENRRLLEVRSPAIPCAPHQSRHPLVPVPFLNAEPVLHRSPTC